MINNGNRTEWSPLLTVYTIRVIKKLDNHEVEVRLILLIRSMITDRIGHYKKSCNQLIKTMTKFEKETRLKQLTLRNARQQLVHTHVMFCPLTQV